MVVASEGPKFILKVGSRSGRIMQVKKVHFEDSDGERLFAGKE